MIKEFNDIKSSDNWHSIEFVDKGWSDDKKYHIITKSNEHLLLRLSNTETYDIKKKEFDVIRKVSKLGFEMSIPYEFGRCKKGVYMILKWIVGLSMEEAIVEKSLNDQYQLGYEAGLIQKKIHEVDIDVEKFSWIDYFNNKIERKKKMYNNSPRKYKRGEIFLDYIEKTRLLLENKSLVLQHGDYHIGNMVLNEEGKVGIFDFNRFDYGDPWEEFNRIVWDVNKSPAFATGRIDGYFNSEVPEEFFKFLGLYIACNTLSSLPWALDYGEKDIQTMISQADDILCYFNDFKLIVPTWYSETKRKMK